MPKLVQAAAEGMPKVNRRAAISVAAAAIATAAGGITMSAPATTAPERAQRDPKAPNASQALPSTPVELARYHLAAYKAAAQAADPTITGWSRVVPEDDRGYAFMLVARR